MDLKKLLLLVVFTPIFAAGPDGFKLWKSAELKAYDKAAPLADFGNHTAQMNHREKNGEVEIHQNWADVMVIESGEATMAIGGTPVNAKTTAPGEIRAESATGAEQHDLEIARCDRVEKKQRRIGALIESSQPRAIAVCKMLADRSQGDRLQQILVTVHAIRRHDRFACAVATRGR